MVAKKEEIAVIGGGLAGCLTALMLAKRPDLYHVTLIEANDTLLNGASVIASRLHLGGEYPLDSQTASDCLTSAIIWKLLMPDNPDNSIYTKTPPTKFLVAQATQNDGTREPHHPERLTVEKAHAEYEKLRVQYEEIFKKVQQYVFGGDEQKTAQALFGSYKEGEFYRKLDLTADKDKQDCKDYPNIAGGLQSQEIGLNVPKYLAMIQSALEAQEKAGNMTILKNHKVTKEGIKGKFGNFKIHCENDPVIHASQVVQAAWQGGPEIMPKHTRSKQNGNRVIVAKRAMLLVDLPEGWTTPPAFVMLADDGGMLAPINDRKALCYLPAEGMAYSKPDHQLTSEKPSLPEDWEDIGKYEKDIDPGVKAEKEKAARKTWTSDYVKAAQNRFPVLKNAKADTARLVVRNTLKFQKENSQRQLESAKEVRHSSLSVGHSMGLEMRQTMGQWQDASPPPVVKVERGLFTLCPTKATYAVHAAVQAATMVNKRTHQRQSASPVSPSDTLGLILSSGKREEYSLASMEVPDKEYLDTFIAQRHPDLDPKMMQETWPQPTLWADTVHKPRTGWAGGRGG